MNTSDARERLAEILNKVAFAKDRVRITRRGREIAAVVPIAETPTASRSQPLTRLPWFDYYSEDTYFMRG